MPLILYSVIVQEEMLAVLQVCLSRRVERCSMCGEMSKKKDKCVVKGEGKRHQRWKCLESARASKHQSLHESEGTALRQLECNWGWKIYLELTNFSTWLKAEPTLNLGFEPCPVVFVCTYCGTELAHIVLPSCSPIFVPRASVRAFMWPHWESGSLFG